MDVVHPLPLCLSVSLSLCLALSLATVEAFANARGVCVRLTGGGSQIEELHTPIHKDSLDSDVLDAMRAAAVEDSLDAGGV